MALSLSAQLALFPGVCGAAAWNDANPYFYNNPNTRLNDFQLNPNNRLDLNTRLNLPLPSIEIRTPMAPDLTINNWTIRLPEINVVDIGNSVWTYQRVEHHFNSDIKAYDRYAANISFQFGEAVAERGIGMDLGNMTFPTGRLAPESFRRSYRDELGNMLVRERTGQTSRPNESYNRFVQYTQQEGQTANANRPMNPDANALRRPVEPSTELIDGFTEKWRLSMANEGGIGKTSQVGLEIDSIKYETNFHRFVSEYSGTLKDGRQTISFTVRSPQDDKGSLQSLTLEISAKGAPTATIQWKPAAGQNAEAAFALLRENLPAPLFVGPRSNFRLNGVDMLESPLRVTPQGDLSPKQLGTAHDLANLMGKENLGIEVSFSPPARLSQGPGEQAPDSPKPGFSLGNSLRNLWYMVTGRWSDVKGMRQQLTTMRDSEPGKFVLSAGFSDPGFMGIKDLSSALEASKRIYLPRSKIQSMVSDQSSISNQAGLSKSEKGISRPGFFAKAVEVLTTPIGFVFKTAVETVKTGLSIVFGGRIKEEPIKGYDLIANPDDLNNLATPGKGKMDFYVKNKQDPQTYTPSAVFEIRQGFKTPPVVNILPHAPFISVEKGASALDTDVYFNQAPVEFIDKLKTADSIDLYFHGYNVGANKSLDIRNNFSKLLDLHGYKNINALISWSGDVGNNFFSKLFFFNRAVKSAKLSWEGVGRAEEFIRIYNPDIRINATTHSLGASLLLEAANHGVKFGTVILIAPAVDNEALSPGGKFEGALQNIDKLIVVYSRNQSEAFIPYMLARFDYALGDVGPSGVVKHPKFVAIDATESGRNAGFGIHVENHSDIYDDEMIRMMIKYLQIK